MAAEELEAAEFDWSFDNTSQLRLFRAGTM